MIKCHTNYIWVDIQHTKTECSLFIIFKLPWQIHNNTKPLILQDSIMKNNKYIMEYGSDNRILAKEYELV